MRSKAIFPIQIDIFIDKFIFKMYPRQLKHHVLECICFGRHQYVPTVRFTETETFQDW